METKAKPLAIHCYAAFSDGVIRGVWIDMDRKIVHIENTPVSQVPRDMMQVLDTDTVGIAMRDQETTPQASENLKEMQANIEEAVEHEIAHETRRGRPPLKRAG